MPHQRIERFDFERLWYTSVYINHIILSLHDLKKEVIMLLDLAAFVRY